MGGYAITGKSKTTETQRYGGKGHVNEMTWPSTLRIGINFGNVLLARRDEAGAPGGLAPDLAAELIRRLNVRAQFITYESAGRMADGARADEWDVAFLATDPARAQEIIFTA